jgi:hypothetical protein
LCQSSFAQILDTELVQPGGNLDADRLGDRDQGHLGALPARAGTGALDLVFHSSQSVLEELLQCGIIHTLNSRL